MEFYTSVTFAFWTLYFIIMKGIGLKSGGTDESVQMDTLVLLHVLFRHGNRTANGPEELYPKDPYINETYFPFGLGQLTNAGKIKEYSIGKGLRFKYNKFLGGYYYPEMVEALSTDYNRTKASLQLVLAGLFPPKAEEIWNDELNWQPIPYNYVPTSRDKILIGVNCPNYVKLYNQHIKSVKQQTEFDNYKSIFNYISNSTGLNITTFIDVYNLYFGLATEEEWGFKLPPWTKELWPEIILDLAIKHYFVETATTDLRRMASGYFLQKMIRDTISKINGTDNGKKIYLYSAHENNIADALIVLGIFEPFHMPTYGAYLTFEVHKINNSYGIKIYYENYTTTKPELLKLPACESFCEINKFISLIEEYFPNDDLCGISDCL